MSDVHVHGNMDKSVEGGCNPLNGNSILQANPAEEESHGVVIKMQEAQRGLAKDDEDGVQ